MDVPYQFKQVWLLLTQDGRKPVLKEVPRATITPVIVNRIAGQQLLHHPTYRYEAGFQQEVEMVRHEGPRITSGGRLGEDTREAMHKLVPVLAVLKDDAPFYPSGHDMMHSARGIDARLPWHN